MVKSSLEVDGMEAIRKKIVELGRKGSRIQNEAIKQGGQILAGAMQKEVPVSDIDHAHIKEDIVVSNVKRIKGVPHVQVGPSKETAWRAHFIEFGTVNMPPNPFMLRSVRLSKESVQGKMFSEVKKGLGL
ncbi:HK97-gp10 family putative phage morphogenesis protein [Peribacillus frigoritolerans]|uniref:HK97-gp10 family putative phage morphogenesis protein n=1 Tax=Peribacillus frigoritolerans TaxID=450367 RepID=UPI003D056026